MRDQVRKETRGEGWGEETLGKTMGNAGGGDRYWEWVRSCALGSRVETREVN